MLLRTDGNYRGDYCLNADNRHNPAQAYTLCPNTPSCAAAEANRPLPGARIQVASIEEDVAA